MHFKWDAVFGTESVSLIEVQMYLQLSSSQIYGMVMSHRPEGPAEGGLEGCWGSPRSSGSVSEGVVSEASGPSSSFICLLSCSSSSCRIRKSAEQTLNF